MVIVLIIQTTGPLSVTTALLATYLLVPMGQYVLVKTTYVMGIMIVRMVQMNLSPSASLHVQLICFLVQIDQNVFPSQSFATGIRTLVVMTIHTILPLFVTTVLLTICSSVRC